MRGKEGGENEGQRVRGKIVKSKEEKQKTSQEVEG